MPFQQDDIRLTGAAMECRINAENPNRNFQPCPGPIHELFVPGGLGIRWDSHVQSGYSVPPFYDSMIGKLIVHKPTREEAIACMIRGLEEIHLKGIETTASFQIRVLKEQAFIDGTVDTKWVERELLATG